MLGTRKSVEASSTEYQVESLQLGKAKWSYWLKCKFHSYLEEVLADRFNFFFEEAVVEKLNPHLRVFFFSFHSDFFNSDPQVCPFLVKLALCFVVCSQLIISRIVVQLPLEKELLTWIRSKRIRKRYSIMWFKWLIQLMTCLFMKLLNLQTTAARYCIELSRSFRMFPRIILARFWATSAPFSQIFRRVWKISDVRFLTLKTSQLTTKVYALTMDGPQ